MKYSWILAVGLTPVLAANASTDGDEREQIEHLLVLAEKPSAKNLKAVESFYASLDSARRNRSSVKYAYGVALIQQRRLHEAANVFEELAVETPADCSVWRTRIWLSLTLGENIRSLANIDDYIARYEVQEVADKEKLHDPESATFLGAVSGFLSGPWSQKVRPAVAERLESRLRALIDDGLRTSFDKARAQVVARHDHLRKANEEHAQNELTAGTKRLDQDRNAMDLKTKKLSQKQQSLKEKEVKRAEDADAKTDGIDEQLKVIADKRRPLLAQIVALEAQRVALVSQLLPEQTPQAPPQLVAHNMREWIANQRTYAAQQRSFGANVAVFNADVAHNRAIRQLLGPLVTRLNALEAQVAVLNQRELELLAERGATGIKLHIDLANLAQKEQALNKDKKHLDYDSNRLKAKPVSYTARLRAETRQLTQFSTYFPFAFESERERLIKEASK